MGDASPADILPEKGKRRRGKGRLALLGVFFLFNSCHGETHNPSELRAIRMESEQLMVSHPIDPAEGVAEISKGEWPPVIASLKPYRVTVYTWGVDIWMKPFFDGGWGYDVARNKQDLPMLQGCYDEMSPGVYWHGPC